MNHILFKPAHDPMFPHHAHWRAVVHPGESMEPLLMLNHFLGTGSAPFPAVVNEEELYHISLIAKAHGWEIRKINVDSPGTSAVECPSTHSEE